MDRLFTYGTLMCSDIMTDVSGLTLVGVPATLHGFQRRAIRGEPYPALIPAPGQTTLGCLYTGITALAWQRLDDFEGDFYERQSVPVTLTDGTTLPACTYVLCAGQVGILSDAEWDFDQFLAIGKPQFESQYKGYQALAHTPGDQPCKP